MPPSPLGIAFSALFIAIVELRTMSPILIATAIGLVAFYVLKWVSTKRLRVALPPGPPRKPLIGNLGDLPSHTDKAWEYWLKHKDLYGELLIADISDHSADLYVHRSNQLPNGLRPRYHHHQ